MKTIEVHLKNGNVERFIHEGRPGGSYTKMLTFKEGFAIIEDEWGKRTAFPAQDIERVIETPDRTW